MRGVIPGMRGVPLCMVGRSPRYPPHSQGRRLSGCRQSLVYWGPRPAGWGWQNGPRTRGRVRGCGRQWARTCALSSGHRSGCGSHRTVLKGQDCHPTTLQSTMQPRHHASMPPWHPCLHGLGRAKPSHHGTPFSEPPPPPPPKGVLKSAHFEGPPCAPKRAYGENNQKQGVGPERPFPGPPTSRCDAHPPLCVPRSVGNLGARFWEVGGFCSSWYTPGAPALWPGLRGSVTLNPASGSARLACLTLHLVEASTPTT